jgi:hypothetical protein
MTDPLPHIVVRQGGAFFRIEVRPPKPMPSDFREPRTDTAKTRAFETADLLAKITGWPVIDETKGGGNVPAR